MILPYELIGLIAEQADCTPTLLALCQTSLQFQLEAERILYACTKVTEGATSFRFLTSIRAAPRRARLVRVYHVHTTHHAPLHRGVIWTLHQELLPTMINLRELAFFDLVGHPGATTFLPHGCILPKLKTFRWTLSLARTGIKYVKQAHEFLVANPQITHLHWSASHPCPPPASVLRNLTVLEGDAFAMLDFLPNRPKIDTLIWTQDLDNQLTLRQLDSVRTGIAPYLCQIDALSYHESIRPYFNQLAVHFTSVRVLEVFHNYVDELNIRKLPKLNELIVSVCLGPKYIETTTGDFLSRSPSLKYIFIAVGKNKSDGSFRYWAIDRKGFGRRRKIRKVLSESYVREDFLLN